MSRRRFFVDAIRDGRAELAGEDAAHLARVLRVRAGQQYEISDNRRLYLAAISSVTAKRVEFRVLEALDSAAPPLAITLLAALIKFDRFEWMVEKVTELGVAKIVPMNCERSEKGLAAAAVRRRERWQRIARESSQQARRVYLPEIAPPEEFDRAVRAAGQLRYALDEKAGAPPLCDVLPERAERQAGAAVYLAVGPEGGWTEGERSCLAGAGWKAVGVGFHILRTETAAIAALSLIAAGWLPRSTLRLE